MNFKFILIFLLGFNLNVNANLKIPSYKSDKIFIKISGTGTYSSHFVNYSNNISEEFLVQKNDSFFFIPEYNFINYSSNGEKISLVKFNLDFLNIKDNVIKFIQPDLFIKVLYVINNRYYLRITDAMRTLEQQNKYMRRGWSSRESSPHLFGLAFDINDYTREEREDMRIRSATLGLKFLEHGRHRHIHLEDSLKWELNPHFYNDLCCNVINQTLEQKNSLLFKPVKLTPFESDNNYLPVELNVTETGLMKIVYGTNYKKIYEITCGVFEPGLKKIFINKYLSEFKSGYYKIYLNDKLIEFI